MTDLNRLNFDQPMDLAYETKLPNMGDYIGMIEDELAVFELIDDLRHHLDTL